MKKNVGMTITIIILGLLVIVLGGYVVYDKVLERDTDVNNNNNVNQNNDGANYNNWMDYIMNSDINSIKLNYCVDDVSNDMGVPTLKTINITKSDLDRIFTEMKKGTVAKNYYGGLGGPCMTSIEIDYTNNETQYELDLVLYKFIDPEFITDQKILSYLENTDYTIKKYSEDIDLTNEPYKFEHIYDDNIVDVIINEYTK